MASLVFVSTKTSSMSCQAGMTIRVSSGAWRPSRWYSGSRGTPMLSTRCVSAKKSFSPPLTTRPFVYGILKNNNSTPCWKDTFPGWIALFIMKLKAFCVQVRMIARYGAGTSRLWIAKLSFPTFPSLYTIWITPVRRICWSVATTKGQYGYNRPKICKISWNWWVSSMH